MCQRRDRPRRGSAARLHDRRHRHRSQQQGRRQHRRCETDARGERDRSRARRVSRHAGARAGHLHAAIRRRRQRGHDRIDRAQGRRLADECHRPDRRRSGGRAGARPTRKVSSRRRSSRASATGGSPRVMEIYSPNLALRRPEGRARGRDVGNRPGRSRHRRCRSRPGGTPEVGLLLARASTRHALPPGRYLARAMVFQNGKPQGHIYRPFRIVAGSAAAATAGGGGLTMPSALPAELLGSMLANLPTFDRKEFLDADRADRGLRRGREGAAHGEGRARVRAGPASSDRRRSKRSRPAISRWRRSSAASISSRRDRTIARCSSSRSRCSRRRRFAPTRLYLGAALVQSNRHREAAGLLQSVTPDIAGSGAGRAARRPRAGCGPAMRRSRSPRSRKSRQRRPIARRHARSRSRTSPAIVRPTRCRCSREYLETNPNEQDILLAARLRDVRNAFADAARRDAGGRSHARADVGQGVRRAEGRAPGARGRVDCLPAGGKMTDVRYRKSIAVARWRCCDRRSAERLCDDGDRSRRRRGARHQRRRTAAHAGTPAGHRVRHSEVQLDRRSADLARRRRRSPSSASSSTNQKDDYETSLWMVPADGSDAPRRLTSGTRDQSPRWSPDGTAARLRPLGRSRRPRTAGADLRAVAGRRRGARDHRSRARRRRDRCGRPTARGSPSRARRVPTKPPPTDAAKTGARADAKSDVRVITSAVYRSNGGGWNDDAASVAPLGHGRADRRRDAEGAAAHERHVLREAGRCGRPTDARLFFTSNRVEDVVLPGERQRSLRRAGRWR